MHNQLRKERGVVQFEQLGYGAEDHRCKSRSKVSLPVSQAVNGNLFHIGKDKAAKGEGWSSPPFKCNVEDKSASHSSCPYRVALF